MKYIDRDVQQSKGGPNCCARMDGDTKLVSASEHAYTERLLAAKIRQMQETIERLDGENHKLTEKLEEIGTAFNEQISLVGWHEEREKEYTRLLKQAVEDIRKLGNPGGDCLYLGGCKNCPLYKDQASECRCWNRETEALELIGGEDG